MNIKDTFNKSRKLPYFKMRLALAILLMPLGPYLLLKIAQMAMFSGDYIYDTYFSATDSPIAFIAIAALGPAMIIVMFISIFTNTESD